MTTARHSSGQRPPLDLKRITRLSLYALAWVMGASIALPLVLMIWTAAFTVMFGGPV